jgi:hypothetical protein
VTPTTAGSTLEGAVRTLQDFVRTARPATYSGDEARRMVELLGRAERAAASGIALLSPVVVESGAFAKGGHASAPDWLGSVSGTSPGVAKGRLAAAERAASEPELATALHQGTLSAPELGLITKAAAADPESVGTMLELVDAEASHQELSAKAAEVRAAARSKESERARRERVHALPHFRWRQDDEGGIRGEFLCDEVAWARVAPGLEAATKALWKAAGAQEGESLDAHRLDAFLEIMAGGPVGPARSEVLVIIDAEALRRGTTSTGEICEIDGIGPVPVESATELLGEGSLRFLIKEGRDIRTVTTSSRDLATRTARALAARDRSCVVPGCGKRLGLQADHCFVDYHDDGPTELGNLALLCPSHHDMKTHGGWKLTGGPDTWRWVPPPNPPSAGAIARAKKVAVAKAKANAGRNTPRRT